MGIMDHLCIRSIGYQKTNFGSELNAFQVEFGSISGILRLGQISTQQLLFFLCPSLQRQGFHKPVSNRKKLHRLKRMHLQTDTLTLLNKRSELISKCRKLTQTSYRLIY